MELHKVARTRADDDLRSVGEWFDRRSAGK
jgi:hypothetical protein